MKHLDPSAVGRRAGNRHELIAERWRVYFGFCKVAIQSLQSDGLQKLFANTFDADISEELSQLTRIDPAGLVIGPLAP